jgi:predicted DNA-binding transcriptional regulator AlpA
MISHCEIDLIDVSDVGRMLGVGRSRADTISRYRGFPGPVVVKPRVRLWQRAEVVRWLDANRPGWREGTGTA